jgi:hypothetical protein
MPCDKLIEMEQYTFFFFFFFFDVIVVDIIKSDILHYHGIKPVPYYKALIM